MIANVDIRLATLADAADIAAMSRDCIEQGLRWSWQSSRVAKCIRDSSTNVVVVREHGTLVGFAIMRYGDEEAQLFLFAVAPAHRRRGIGAALIAWLETVARTAGMTAMRLQVRANNTDAIAFYRGVGFQPMGRRVGYYDGIEDALFMAKDTSFA